MRTSVGVPGSVVKLRTSDLRCIYLIREIEWIIIDEIDSIESVLISVPQNKSSADGYDSILQLFVNSTTSKTRRTCKIEFLLFSFTQTAYSSPIANTTLLHLYREYEPQVVSGGEALNLIRSHMAGCTAQSRDCRLSVS